MKTPSLNDILNETIRRIKAVIQPKQVIIFGSAVSGKMHKNSDIDLLVITPSGVHRRKTAQKIYRNMIGVGFAVDIVVVTEDDIKQYKDNPAMVIYQALKDGKIIYAS